MFCCLVTLSQAAIQSCPMMYYCTLDITLISCMPRLKCFVARRTQFKVMRLQFWPDTLDRIWRIVGFLFIRKRKYNMPEWVRLALRVWSDVYFTAFSTHWNCNCRRPEEWMSALSEQLVTLMDQFSSEEKWKVSQLIQVYREKKYYEVS